MATASRRSRGGTSSIRPALPYVLAAIIIVSCITWIYMHILVTKSLESSSSWTSSVVGVGGSLPPPSSQPATSSSCQLEYERTTAKQTPGLTLQDLHRSQAWMGNQNRLVQTMKALSARDRPVIGVVAGGSISLGHGITPDNGK